MKLVKFPHKINAINYYQFYPIILKMNAVIYYFIFYVCKLRILANLTLFQSIYLYIYPRINAIHDYY